MKKKIYDCETIVAYMVNGKREERWEVRAVEDIEDGRPVRCKRCYERVRIHRQRIEVGPRDHVEHFVLNENCELCR